MAGLQITRREMAVDRHPRLSLAGILATYCAIEVLFMALLTVTGHEDADHPRTVLSGVIVGACAAVGGMVGFVLSWWIEWRTVGLSTLDDWWIVVRCLRRGRAPLEPRLWWAADQMVERRTRRVRRSRVWSPLLMLCLALLCWRTADPVTSYVMAALLIVAAVVIVATSRSQLGRLARARAELQVRRPIPPETFTTAGWSS